MSYADRVKSWNLKVYKNIITNLFIFVDKNKINSQGNYKNYVTIFWQFQIKDKIILKKKVVSMIQINMFYVYQS